MLKKLNLLLILIIIFSKATMAAVVHGDIYDINFNKLSNTIVEINTIPKQSMIVKDSGYSFNLAPGNYIIKAFYIKNNALEHFAQEDITIEDANGDYNLDLILFPYLEDENISELDIPLAEYYQKENGNFSVLLIILSVISLFVVVYLISSFRKTIKKSEEINKNLEKLETKEPELKDEFLERAYSIIKEEKRVSQKDLRKKLMLSEAKVSLILTQLESEENIKKIKKGRGNIIIFIK
ncbi:hypothetical protein HYX18_01730 [Candidatus Woesearchaeota archaeon]|nr:hypothetical protein [Candidatus Woesearchaeota archaeon]